MIAIYGKKKGDKKFKILGDGYLQSNLIYGEYYKDEQRSELNELCSTLMEINEDFIFEVRDYKGEGSLFEE